MRKITDEKIFRLACFSLMIISAFALFFKTAFMKTLLIISFVLFIIYAAINVLFSIKEKKNKKS